MFDEKDGYLGFTFAGHHSSEFGLTVVSDGSRYHQNLSNNFNDTIITVPGKNGGYYFGTQLNTRDIGIECAFDNMTSQMKHKIEQWLYPNQLGWLIFDEMPYKKYYVKISSLPSFSFIPFDNVKRVNNLIFNRDILKGELSISFFSFYEFAFGNENYELPSINNNIINQRDIDSGILPNGYYDNVGNVLFPHYQLDTVIPQDNLDVISENKGFALYNAGNGVSDCNFYFTVKASDISENSPLVIFNLEDAQSYIINDPIPFLEENNFDNIDLTTIKYYRIGILGTKKEIWLIGMDNNYNVILNEINIGSCYNQYFPKVYHRKNTEVMIANQSITNVDGEEAVESLIYPYTINNNDDYYPSDSNRSNVFTFEEFQHDWSDYCVCTPNGIFQINSILNSSVLYINLDGSEESLPEDTIVYLIYPDKFTVNKEIKNLIVEYEYTYI